MGCAPAAMKDAPPSGRDESPSGAEVAALRGERRLSQLGRQCPARLSGLPCEPAPASSAATRPDTRAGRGGQPPTRPTPSAWASSPRRPCARSGSDAASRKGSATSWAHTPSPPSPPGTSPADRRAPPGRAAGSARAPRRRAARVGVGEDRDERRVLVGSSISRRPRRRRSLVTWSGLDHQSRRAMGSIERTASSGSPAAGDLAGVLHERAARSGPDQLPASSTSRSHIRRARSRLVELEPAASPRSRPRQLRASEVVRELRRVEQPAGLSPGGRRQPRGALQRVDGHGQGAPGPRASGHVLQRGGHPLLAAQRGGRPVPPALRPGRTGAGQRRVRGAAVRRRGGLPDRGADQRVAERGSRRPRARATPLLRRAPGPRRPPARPRAGRPRRGPRATAPASSSAATRTARRVSGDSAAARFANACSRRAVSGMAVISSAPSWSSDQAIGSSTSASGFPAASPSTCRRTAGGSRVGRASSSVAASSARSGPSVSSRRPVDPAAGAVPSRAAMRTAIGSLSVRRATKASTSAADGRASAHPRPGSRGRSPPSSRRADRASRAR